MKIYLVGGAVRDKYLGYLSTENDWVVVGARAADLIQQGFQQVGQDFPVFLHPVTREEYALARTERKSGPGYHGFTLNFTPEVSLQDDLARRDLTINAMAMDEKGHLIDPYHGLDDLKAKLFRHVSPAFVEDPVRVLRVARFSARYHHLGFTLAAQTRSLMYLMVKQGELNHLVPERVWQEWLKSLAEQDPAQFIIILRACNALAVVLPELDALFGVPNDASDCPEIDAGMHSLNALSMAAKLSNEQDVRFAATLLKLGQVTIPINQWPCHATHNYSRDCEVYNTHTRSVRAEEGREPCLEAMARRLQNRARTEPSKSKNCAIDYSGKELIEHVCQRLRVPVAYRQLAIMSAELHLQIHRLYELSADEILTCLEKADAFRRPERFDKLLLICEADKRGSDSSRNYPQANHWRQLRQACHLINASDLIKQGMRGEAIKVGLTQSRLERINTIIGTIHE